MRHYRGSEKVAPGLYFNFEDLAFKSMAEEGHLPGDEMNIYRRVPALALLVVGPLLGGLYVMFLPLIGFAMLAWVVGGKAVEVTAHAGAASARVLRPAWEPARAFLSRGKAARKATGAPKAAEKDTWAEGVKKELEPGEDEPA